MISLLLLACARLNPFRPSDSYYVNPAFAHNIERLLEASRTELSDVRRKELDHLRGTPTAIWLDSKSMMASFAEILATAASELRPPAVVVVLYNLPNRDCSAKASAGEICCYRHLDWTCDMAQAGGCDQGLQEYELEYIRPFAALLRAHASVPVVAILEPDSLPNLVTNTANPSCGSNQTTHAYIQGMQRAVSIINHEAPHAALYLDAGHGGWYAASPDVGKMR